MARDFDGSSQYIDFGSIASPTADFFISAWVKPDPLVGNRMEIVSNETGSIGGGALYVTTSGKPRFGVFNGASYPEVEGATTLTDGVWTHLLGVRDNTADELRIYINGALDGTASAFTTAPAAGGTLTIARSPLGAFRYFAGAIGRIAIGNSVPSGGEISGLATAANDPATVITCAHVIFLDGPDPEPDEITAATGDLLPNGSEPTLVDGPEVGGGGGGTQVFNPALSGGFNPLVGGFQG